MFFSLRLCRSELSVEKTSVLQSELDSCNQLQELEPLNKCKCVCVFDLVLSDYTELLSFPGCLLTVILLMRALDPLGYEKETLAHFQTLKVNEEHPDCAACVTLH